MVEYLRIFAIICPYFQRLARQGILESAVAGGALWTPGSFWAEPGHIVGSLLGGRDRNGEASGDVWWCLMAEDAPDCFCQEAPYIRPNYTKLYVWIHKSLKLSHVTERNNVMFALHYLRHVSTNLRVLSRKTVLPFRHWSVKSLRPPEPRLWVVVLVLNHTNYIYIIQYFFGIAYRPF